MRLVQGRFQAGDWCPNCGVGILDPVNPGRSSKLQCSRCLYAVRAV